MNDNRVYPLIEDEKKLRIESERIEEGENIDKLKDILEQSLYYHGGLGLSAIQLGIPKRICIFNVKEPIFLINPTIIEREDEVEFVEGCLSFPNQVIKTKRNVRVAVEADNYEGILEFGPWNDQYEMDDEDLLESIVVQHEIDHMNGKLIFDREVKNQPHVKEFDVGRNDKVVIENPSDGEKIQAKYKYIKEKIELGGWRILEVL